MTRWLNNLAIILALFSTITIIEPLNPELLKGKIKPAEMKKKKNVSVQTSFGSFKANFCGPISIVGSSGFSLGKRPAYRWYSRLIPTDLPSFRLYGPWTTPIAKTVSTLSFPANFFSVNERPVSRSRFRRTPTGVSSPSVSLYPLSFLVLDSIRRMLNAWTSNSSRLIKVTIVRIHRFAVRVPFP